jgi:hypothetical protein
MGSAPATTGGHGVPVMPDPGLQRFLIVGQRPSKPITLHHEAAPREPHAEHSGRAR